MKQDADTAMNATATPPARSDAARNWIALGTIARREVSRSLRIWSQTLVPPKIRKYRVMVIAGGIRVWPQMRMIRLTSRRTMVPSATRFCCMAVG